MTITGIGNYTGSATSATFTIKQKQLTPSITGTATKIYDNTTTVPANSGLSISLDGIVNSDDVSATAQSYTYDNANVGTGKTITATGIQLSGTKSGNYSLSQPTATTNTGEITRAPVSLTFADQTITYGETSAEATADPDSEITYSYMDKTDSTKKGTGWPVNAGTYTVTASVAETKNYQGVSKSITLTINPKTVTATVTVSGEYTYNSGEAIIPDAANVTATCTDGTIAPKEYTFTCSDNINAGTATITLEDVAGGNYVVNGSGTFEITKASQAPLNIAYGENIIYGGTYEPSISGGSGNGAVTWAVTGPATVDNDGKVTVTGVGEITVTATKVEDNNYTGISATCTLTAAQRPVTITGITGATVKTYDGTTACDGNGLTLTLDTVLAGDTVTATATYVYDNASAGESKTVTASKFTLTGTDAKKYCIASSQSNELSATGKIIQAAALTPTAGMLTVENRLQKDYSFDLTKLLPAMEAGKELGTVSYALGTVNFTVTGYYVGGEKIDGTSLTLPIQSVDSQNEGEIGTVTVTISSTNYENMTATITVSASN